MGDREKVKQQVKEFTEVLRLIAVHLTQQGVKSFGEEDVPPLCLSRRGGEKLRHAWLDLQEGIHAGNIPLLLYYLEDGEKRYKFAYRSFQSYLATQPAIED